MQRYIIMTALFTALIARADLVPRIAWQVDLEDPRTKKIELLYGETVDLQCMFRNYFSPLDISGAAVTLHARTNGMAASESFQVTGSSQPGGIATVRVNVDAWLPQGLETVDYTLAVVQTNSINVLRAYGSIYLRGSTAASVSAPVPVSVFEQLNAALSNHINTASSNMQALSNNLMVAIARPGAANTLISADGKSWVNINNGVCTLYSVSAPGSYLLIDTTSTSEWGYYPNNCYAPPRILPPKRVFVVPLHVFGGEMAAFDWQLGDGWRVEAGLSYGNYGYGNVFYGGSVTLIYKNYEAYWRWSCVDSIFLSDVNKEYMEPPNFDKHSDYAYVSYITQATNSVVITDAAALDFALQNYYTKAYVDSFLATTNDLANHIAWAEAEISALQSGLANALKPSDTNGYLRLPDLPDETDPRAMRAYHYGDPDIEITPAGDFGFDAGTITGYTGSNPDIVLPYEINGVPVVAIGTSAFEWTGVVKTLKAPKTLTTINSSAFIYSPLTNLNAPSLTHIGNQAFSECPLTNLNAPSLTSIGGYAFAGSYLTTLTAPSLTTIGGYAFYGSSLKTLIAPSLTSIGDYAFSFSSLTTIYYGGNQPTAGASIYYGAPDNLISYITNPTATGWGDTFGDRPVVRLPLYADEVYSGGSLVATISPSSRWTTNIVASGAQTLKGTWGSQPRLQLSGSTTIDIDWTTYDTNGINRISLTIVSGEHPVTWSTNNIEFATAPELSTNAPNTILIRKIGTAKAQGRQL